MLMLPSLSMLDKSLSVGVYLCTAPTDMRKGFDSLASLVQEHLGQDPLSGDLFLFVSRGRDRIKGLLWQPDGFAIWYKRLEEGIVLVQVRRRDDGRWLLQNRYPGRTFFELENLGEPSRWNTLRALRVLRWWEAGMKRSPRR